MDELILKPPEVAKLFKVSIPTVYKWKDRGILPFVEIEGTIRFKKDDIFEVIRKHHHKAKAT